MFLSTSENDRIFRQQIEDNVCDYPQLALYDNYLAYHNGLCLVCGPLAMNDLTVAGRLLIVVGFFPITNHNIQ